MTVVLVVVDELFSPFKEDSFAKGRHDGWLLRAKQRTTSFLICRLSLYMLDFILEPRLHDQDSKVLVVLFYNI